MSYYSCYHPLFLTLPYHTYIFQKAFTLHFKYRKTYLHLGDEIVDLPARPALLLGEAPRGQEQLDGGVDVVIEDDLVLVGQEEVAYVAVLHLGEGLGAVEGLRAAVAGGAARVPALAPVAVGVHADTVEAGVHRPDIRWG